MPPPATKDTVMVSPARTTAGPDIDALPAAKAAGAKLTSRTATIRKQIILFKSNTSFFYIFPHYVLYFPAVECIIFCIDINIYSSTVSCANMITGFPK